MTACSIRRSFFFLFLGMSIACIIVGSLFISNTDSVQAQDVALVLAGAGLPVLMTAFMSNNLRVLGDLHRHPLLVWTAVAAVTLSAAAVASAQTTNTIVAIALSTVQLITVVMYDEWYAPVPPITPSAELEVGGTLDATFTSSNGDKVTLAGTPGPLLLLFVRGTWCPLCMTQVRELVDRLHAFKAAGITVAAIGGTGTLADTQATAARFNAPMEFWADEGLAEVRRLGLLHVDAAPVGVARDGDSTAPAMVLLDDQHKVVWRFVSDDYRNRVTPDTYSKAVEAHLGVKLGGPKASTAVSPTGTEQAAGQT